MPSERIGSEVARNIIECINEKCSCVDEYFCDQIIPYISLLGGKISTHKISSHAHTMIHIAEKILNAKYRISNVNGCKNILFEGYF